MKIGLALGAGAARGWSHIGIIHALEALGIKIDIVAGCSIGAYVGSTYASGKLDDLQAWSTSLTEWQVLSLMGIGLRKGGLASGQKVFDKHIEDFCAPTYEEMAIPFAAVATDLNSGREVIFNQGEVGDSIKASCAIPALFSPVYINDRWLIDGAVVNPVPVNLCRQLGADFVIAVNLNADFRPQRLEQARIQHEKIQQKTDDFFQKGQNAIRQWFSPDSKDDATAPAAAPVPGIFGVMSNALEILQARVTRSRLAGDPPDILIEPQLVDVGLMEFHRAAELYDLGHQAVARVAEQIKYQLMLDQRTESPSVNTNTTEELEEPKENEA